MVNARVLYTLVEVRFGWQFVPKDDPGTAARGTVCTYPIFSTRVTLKRYGPWIFSIVLWLLERS